MKESKYDKVIKRKTKASHEYRNLLYRV